MPIVTNIALALAIPLVATVEYNETALLQFTPTQATTLVTDWWAVDEIDPGISTRVVVNCATKNCKLVEVKWKSDPLVFPTVVYVYARSQQDGQSWPAETVVAVRFVPAGWVTPVVSAAPARGKR